MRVGSEMKLIKKQNGSEKLKPDKIKNAQQERSRRKTTGKCLTRNIIFARGIFNEKCEWAEAEVSRNFPAQIRKENWKVFWLNDILCMLIPIPLAPFISMTN